MLIIWIEAFHGISYSPGVLGKKEKKKKKGKHDLNFYITQWDQKYRYLWRLL